MCNTLVKIAVEIIGAALGIGTVITVCEKENKRAQAQHQFEREEMQRFIYVILQGNESLRKQREEAMRNLMRELDILANY